MTECFFGCIIVMQFPKENDHEQKEEEIVGMVSAARDALLIQYTGVCLLLYFFYCDAAFLP